MLVVPISEKEEAIRLYDFLSEKGIPVAIEDVTPFLVWLITTPCDPQIEHRFARSLLEEAGMDIHGFTEQTMSFLQDEAHKAAVEGRCRFVEDPKTWSKIVNRLPETSIPPIDIV